MKKRRSKTAANVGWLSRAVASAAPLLRLALRHTDDVGFLLVVYGLWRAYPPAAVMLVGLVLAIAGVVYRRRRWAS